MTAPISDGARFVIDALQSAGFRAYIVGGCVRDGFLRKEPTDWDITTNATPDDVLSIFRKRNVYVIPTGVQHGTVTVLFRNAHYEVTTFRKDGDYSDGRRPDSVTFTDDLTEDLLRRDFTINAIAYNDREGFIDPFGGMADIERRLIRCVGSTSDRFSEDYLRMLRAYRFAATLDFALDGDIVAYVQAHRQNVNNVSAERILSELTKTLTNGYPNRIPDFTDMFLTTIIPDVTDTSRVNDKLRTCKNDLITSLCAIFDGLTQSRIEHAMKALRFDNKTIVAVKKVISLGCSPDVSTKTAIKHLLKRVGVEAFRDWMRFRNSDSSVHAMFDDIIRHDEPFTIRMLNITGEDIMSVLGEKPGLRIGQTLDKLLDRTIEHPERNHKALLLDQARNILEDK